MTTSSSPDTQKQFGNYAFISYKREDERWAKWLQHKLETYRLPAVIRTQADMRSPYLRPVFRDNTDLSGGGLASQLRSELDDSRYLIVICSPAATKSAWVNAEIQTFIDEGRTDHIIPFVVDGTPRAKNPADEAFPPALLALPPDKELLGINVHEVGTERAFIRLVATMLNVKFDMLWQRHRRRQRRNRIIAACCAAVLLLGALFVWEYNRPTFEYYASYVDCNGVPEGVSPLSEALREHGPGHYRFRYERAPIGHADGWARRLVAVECVNASGAVIEPYEYSPFEGASIIKIDYSPESGKPVRLNFCEANGKVQLRHLLSERGGVPASVADLIHSKEHVGSGFGAGKLSQMKVDDDDSDVGQASIVRYVYTRDRKGHITSQTFHANNDPRIDQSAICDANGIYGYRFTLDSVGRRTRLQYIGADGSPVCNKRGVAAISYAYDANGALIEENCYDLDGQPALNEELWATLRCERDSLERITTYRLYDTEGKLTNKKENGVAGVVNTYDDKGNIIEGRFFDNTGAPANLIGGYAIHRCKYDRNGRLIEVSYYDVDEQPTVSGEGVFRYEFGYDKRGNRTFVKGYDTAGALAVNDSGWAAVTYTFDSDSNPLRAEYFDTDLNLLSPLDGIAVKQNSYDGRGNLTCMEFFDNQGNRLNNEYGVARLEFRYDERDNMIESSYFDAEERPCYSKSGIHSIHRDYDEYGHVTKFAYFDVDGTPAVDNEGVAERRYTYNRWGKIESAEYLGSDGKPALANDGTAGYHNYYTPDGLLSMYVNLDTSGKPTVDNDGVAIYRHEYDKRRNRVSTTCYDADTVATVDKDGIHRGVNAYDERGNWIVNAAYDSEGKLVARDNGELFQKVSYNERGQGIRVENYNDAGELAPGNGGYAVTELEYDRMGNTQRVRYLDAHRQPVLCTYGMAGIDYEHDAHNRETLCTFIGTDGQPTENFQHIAALKNIYEQRGDTTVNTTLSLDRNGDVIEPNEYLMSAYQIFTDRKGNKIAWISLDSNLRKTNSLWGFAEQRFAYDRYGHQTSCVNFDSDGKLVKDSNGVARGDNSYDKNGFATESRNYDTDGKLCISAQGYAVNKVTRDRFGRVLETSYYGVDEEPIAVGGFHRELRHYDGLEYVSSEYFDAEGNPLGNFIEVPVIVTVSNPLYSTKIAAGSYVVALADWRIGESIERLQRELRASRNRERTVVVLSPEGELQSYTFAPGKLGMSYNSALFDKAQAQEIAAALQ